MKTVILTVRTHKTYRRRSECMTDARRMNKFAPQKVAVWTTIWAAATSGGRPADWLFQALFPGVLLISTYVSPCVSGQGGHAAHSWPREHREANPGCGKDPDSAGKWNAEEPTRLNPKGKWSIRCRQLMKKEIQAVARLSKSKGDQMIPERGISHGLRWKWRKTGKLLEWLAKELLQLRSLGCYHWEDFLVNSKQCTLPVPNRMVPAASGCSWYSCSIHSHLLGQNPNIQAIRKKTACQSHLFQNWLLWGRGGVWCSPQCTDALTAYLQSLVLSPFATWESCFGPICELEIDRFF